MPRLPKYFLSFDIHELILFLNYNRNYGKMFRYLHLYLLKNMYISIILSKENNTFYQVRLNCYFEEDRRVVLIKKTDTYQDLIQLLERQYDAENLVVKYQDGKLRNLPSYRKSHSILQRGIFLT